MTKSMAAYRPAVLPISIFILVILLQLLYIAQTGWGSALISTYPVSDAYIYNYLSWYMAFIDNSGGYAQNIIPFSPYVEALSLSYSIFGPYLWVPFILNSFLSSITITFIALTSREIFSESEGWIAGLLGVFFGLFIFFSGLTLKINLVLPLLSLSIYFTAKHFNSKNYTYLTLSLSLLFIATFIRHNLMSVSFIFLLMIFIRAISSRKINLVFKTTLSTLIAISVIAVIYPWNMNEKEQKFLSPIGINFYAGNSPTSWGGYSKVPGVADNIIGHRLYGDIHAEKAYGRPVTKWESSKYWLNKSFDYFKEHPSEYAILLLKKIGLTFAQTAQGQPEEYRIWRWQRPALVIALIDTGMLVSIVLLATPLLWKKRNMPAIKFLALSILAYAVLMWMFFVFERYRLPLILYYIPLASTAIAHFIKNTSLTQKYKILIAFVTLYSFTLTLNNINQPSAGWSPIPVTERNRINKLLHKEKQISQLMQDVVLEPNAGNWSKLAVIIARRGFDQDALNYASRAIQLDPYVIGSYQAKFEVYLKQNDKFKIQELLTELNNLKDIPNKNKLAFSNLRKSLEIKLY